MMSGYNNIPPPPAYLNAEATLNCDANDDKQPHTTIWDSPLAGIDAPYNDSERCNCCAGNQLQVRTHDG